LLCRIEFAWGRTVTSDCSMHWLTGTVHELLKRLLLLKADVVD